MSYKSTIGIYKRILLIKMVLLSMHSMQGQTDYSWWNEIHNWDGVTHWSKYLVISPERMGPNALPVPISTKGRVIEEDRLWISTNGHWGTDNQNQTYDLFGQWDVNITKWIHFRLSMVMMEYYQTDTITRDYMVSRDYDSKGLGVGDLYFGVDIAMFKDHNFMPDMTLSINLKTASGNNFFAARFTDSPGYSFDIALGKHILQRDGLEIRWFGNIGLFVWQTNREDYFQNDAILYGIGTQFIWNDLELSPSLTGYQGYIDDGDKPVLLRLEGEFLSSHALSYTLLMQYGLRDYPYFSTGLGLRYRFENKLHP